MKKLITIVLILISSFTYSQIDYNIYTGLTKKELRKTFRSDDYKFSFEQKLYVDIDSTGNWFCDDNHYAWLVYCNDNRSLFVFDNETDEIVKYYILYTRLTYYWDYFDYYNENFKKLNGLKWYDDLSIINLIPLQSGYAIYVECKIKKKGKK